MSVFEMTTEPRDTEATADTMFLASPFAGPDVSEPPAAGERVGDGVVDPTLITPFSAALATLGEAELEAEAFSALVAEFDDDEFTEALEALVDEAAARHLASAGTWSHESGAARLADTEVEQWLETIAAEADRRLSELEERFGDRSVDSISATEIDGVDGAALEFAAMDSPLDAQELFFKKLLKKAKKIVKGAAKLVKKGVKAAGRLLPTGRIFRALRKLVRPLLKRVLARAIGKLPAALRPAATGLAGTVLGGRREADDVSEVDALGTEFDEALAEAILTPNDAAVADALTAFEAQATAVTAADSDVEALDVARQRLAQHLVAAEPGRAPTAEMEQFIPAVMAAIPLVKLGVKIIGRKRVVSFVARLLANLIKGMIGPDVAGPLSRHIADAGLRLLGLEAERIDDGMLGAEALVAATEDTIRDVMALPEASLEHELLVEAAVEEAFERAVISHFPPQVLRPDLAMAEQDDERGIWVPLPRSTRPRFRYKKYSVVRPVRITRPLARTVAFAEGDTLEERLLDDGVTSWPVQGEVHIYELLPGGEFGHLAAFELDGESYAEGALEFDELQDDQLLGRPGGVPARPRPAASGGRGRGGLRRPGRRRPGTRVVRVRVPGRRLRRRPRFTIAFDMTSTNPQLRLHLLVSERVAHQMAGDLEHRRQAQVLAAVRRLVGEPRQRAMAARLRRLLTTQGVTLPEGGGATLAAALAEGVARIVAARLPEAAATLAAAAKDPAAGVTLTFTFPFTDRDALTRGEPGEPAMAIRAGMHRE